MKDFDDASGPQIDFCILMQDIGSGSKCIHFHLGVGKLSIKNR